MRKKFVFFLLILVTVAGTFPQEPALSPADILEKIDSNMVFKTARAEIDMVITLNNRIITKSLTSYSRGNEKSYIEFLAPARDKGTKLLKLEDIIYIYYPSAERVMRISGHMLRQSMMGSDFSYEDMTVRAKKLKEEYSSEIKGEETIDGRPCLLMVLTSKIEKQTYFTRKAWVDKERFIVLREELYARSGKLIKEMAVQAVHAYKDRYYPTRLTMKDKLRQNSSTEMIVKKIEFDIPIPDETFSERQLIKSNRVLSPGI